MSEYGTAIGTAYTRETYDVDVEERKHLEEVMECSLMDQILRETPPQVASSTTSMEYAYLQ